MTWQTTFLQEHQPKKKERKIICWQKGSFSSHFFPFNGRWEVKCLPHFTRVTKNVTHSVVPGRAAPHKPGKYKMFLMRQKYLTYVSWGVGGVLKWHCLFFPLTSAKNYKCQMFESGFLLKKCLYFFTVCFLKYVFFAALRRGRAVRHAMQLLDAGRRQQSFHGLLSTRGHYKLDVRYRLKIECWSDNGLKFMIINTLQSEHMCLPVHRERG